MAASIVVSLERVTRRTEVNTDERYWLPNGGHRGHRRYPTQAAQVGPASRPSPRRYTLIFP